MQYYVADVSMILSQNIFNYIVLCVYTTQTTSEYDRKESRKSMKHECASRE